MSESLPIESDRIEETILGFLGGTDRDKRTLQELTATLVRIDGAPLFIGSYLQNNEVKMAHDKLHATYSGKLRSVDTNRLSKIFPNLGNLLFVQGSDTDHVAFSCMIYDSEILYPGIDFFLNHSADGQVTELLKENELRFDSDNLVYAESLELRSQGIIFKDRLIYYHPFLRRYFGARFIDTPSLLMKAQVSEDISLRIAIDPVRITNAKNYMDIIEADVWYGPGFSVEHLNDPSFQDRTIHKRMEGNNKAILDLTYPINATVFDVKNQSTGNKKSLSIEEILPVDGDKGITKKSALHRFAHLEWNIDKQEFSHFDCSVLAYDRHVHTERFANGWSPQLSRTKGKPRKMKLFRLDGSIEPKYALKLLGAFFRYNEMIYEYFGHPEHAEVF